MRVGSIGSSYVPKITAKRGQATPSDSSQSTPSFKADVRFLPTHPWGPEEMPPEHVKQITTALEHAKTAYKDWGSDNILVYLQPRMDTVSGTNKKDIASSINIFYAYKDIEVARKEILENREKDGYTEHDYNIEELKNHDSEVMEDLKTIRPHATGRYKIKGNFLCPNLKDSLDSAMKTIIKYAKYHVPCTQVPIEFEEGYDPKTYEPTPWWIKAMG